MTAPDTEPNRRGQHPVLRVLMWGLAPLADNLEGLSLNRFLAILFAVAAVHGRLVHDSPITGWDVLLATLAGGLAFGKDCYMKFLDRLPEKV